MPSLITSKKHLLIFLVKKIKDLKHILNYIPSFPKFGLSFNGDYKQEINVTETTECVCHCHFFPLKNKHLQSSVQL